MNIVLLQQKFCIVCTKVANHSFISLSLLYSTKRHHKHFNKVLHHFSYQFWDEKNATILHHCPHALESLFSFIYVVGKTRERLIDFSTGNIWDFVSFILPQNRSVCQGKQSHVRFCRTWPVVAVIAWILSSEKYSLYLV